MQQVQCRLRGIRAQNPRDKPAQNGLDLCKQQSIESSQYAAAEKK